MFNNLGGFRSLRSPPSLLLLGAAALATHTAAFTVALTALAVALAVTLAATTSHCGGLGARKYLNSVHWFYISLLFFTRNTG